MRTRDARRARPSGDRSRRRADGDAHRPAVASADRDLGVFAIKPSGVPYEDLSPEQWDVWRRYNEMNSRELTPGWDACIVHDPQPAAMYQLVPEKAKAWIWRCHIDVSTPNPNARSSRSE